MIASVSKAWGLGVAILVAAHLMWFALLQVEQYSGAALTILWSSPAVASLLTACLAPRRKVLTASSLALPTVVLVVSLNASHAALGNVVDFPGAMGALYLAAITLAWSALFCVIGGFVGYLLTRAALPRSSHANPLSAPRPVAEAPVFGTVIDAAVAWKSVSAIVGAMILVLAALVVEVPMGPSASELQTQLAQVLPKGTAHERVTEYIRKAGMGEGDYLERERMINAMVRGVSKGLFFDKSLYVRFRFDEKGQLESFTVDEVSTGL